MVALALPARYPAIGAESVVFEGVVGFTVLVTATAQQVFSEMLRSVVAPGLRERGFRGSGQSFWLPDDRMWAQVGFQKSVSSTKDAVRFTVNLGVTDKAA